VWVEASDGAWVEASAWGSASGWAWGGWRAGGEGVGGTLIVIALPGSSSRLFARSLERNRTVYVPTGKVIERVYGTPWSQLLDPVLDMS
jgi:hypothetical protein